MSKKTGMIFDIKRFAVHDGPGIRTTIFLKGCPLKCWWCHNPEGISLSNEIFFHDYKCMGCKNCVQVCPQGAMITTKNGVLISRERCIPCVKCVDVCPTGALQIAGYEISVEEVLNNIKKDAHYYSASAGGVTFSGGEPLTQPMFLKAVLKRCGEKGIHTTLDTSGYASLKVFKSIVDDVDLLLYDLKLLNDKQHQKYTGVSNKLIKNNLETASKRGKDIILRFSVIPKITDTKENIDELVSFLSSLDGMHEIDLLPFHNVNEKYKRLGKEYKMEDVISPSDGNMKSIKGTLEKMGFYVKIGG
jgi:pyruvate formate lyase activating enzyme